MRFLCIHISTLYGKLKRNPLKNVTNKKNTPKTTTEKRSLCNIKGHAQFKRNHLVNSISNRNNHHHHQHRHPVNQIHFPNIIVTYELELLLSLLLLLLLSLLLLIFWCVLACFLSSSSFAKSEMKFFLLFSAFWICEAFVGPLLAIICCCTISAESGF